MPAERAQENARPPAPALSCMPSWQSDTVSVPRCSDVSAVAFSPHGKLQKQQQGYCQGSSLQTAGLSLPETILGAVSTGHREPAFDAVVAAAAAAAVTAILSGSNPGAGAAAAAVVAQQHHQHQHQQQQQLQHQQHQQHQQQQAFALAAAAATLGNDATATAVAAAPAATAGVVAHLVTSANSGKAVVRVDHSRVSRLWLWMKISELPSLPQQDLGSLEHDAVDRTPTS